MADSETFTMDMNMNMEMTMQMVFYDAYNFQLYFSRYPPCSWQTDTDGKYAAFLIGLIIFSALIPLSDLVQKFISHHLRAKVAVLCAFGVFHFLKTALVYLVMLAVMTYITGLFFAVVCGWTLGKVVLLWVYSVYLPKKTTSKYMLEDVELL